MERVEAIIRNQRLLETNPNSNGGHVYPLQDSCRNDKSSPNRNMIRSHETADDLSGLQITESYDPNLRISLNLNSNWVGEIHWC